MSSASGVGGDPAGSGPNVLGHSASVVGRASSTQQRQLKRAAVTSEETRRAGAQRTGGGCGWGRARAAGRGLIRRKRRWLRDATLLDGGGVCAKPSAEIRAKRCERTSYSALYKHSISFLSFMKHLFTILAHLYLFFFAQIFSYFSNLTT